ncbi:unnamed protein product, partial [Cyprideis torosa]
MEANECGLACLAMLAYFHGFNRNLAQLREELPISRKGVSLYGLGLMAEAIGLKLIPVSLDIDALEELTLPCILHWDLEHFVVLKKYGTKGAIIHDPAVGKRRISHPELRRRFSGVAAMCEKAHTFSRRPHPPKKEGIRGWLEGIPNLYRTIFFVFCVTVLLEILAISMPLLLQWVVDYGLPERHGSLINGLAVGFAILVLGSATLELVRGWTIAILSARLNMKWMQQVLAHLLHLPLDYFQRRHVGDISTSFSSITVIQNHVSYTFISALVDGVMSVGTLAMLAWINPMGAMLAALVVLMYFFFRWLFHSTMVQVTTEKISHSGRQQSHFLESVQGIQSIKLYRRAKHRLEEWRRLAAREVQAEQRLGSLQVAHGAVNKALFGLQRVLFIWLAAQSVTAGHSSLGVMFAFLAYLEQFSQRASGLIDRVLEMGLLRSHAERVGDIVNTQQEKQDDYVDLSPSHPEANRKINESRIHISVEGASYSYAYAEPKVLDNINLEIKDGECVAIVGPSGGGKSTLIKLMLGLLNPQEGRVLINGIPLEEFGRNKVRSLVATVMQDDTLFTGSLIENISFFDPDPDEDWIIECAKIASVHEDISKMPTGYGTLIGDSGQGLSGGQKQRILLARAIYRRPQILVLDEATSHLDVAAERAVNKAIKTLSITRIIVAHRPQTIAMAERVIPLVNG